VVVVVRITHSLEKLAVRVVAVARPKVLAVLAHLVRAILVDMGLLALRHLPAVVVAEQGQLVATELALEMSLVVVGLALLHP
jgi:hypothetical protein